jgi:hypothetical protein
LKTTLAIALSAILGFAALAGAGERRGRQPDGWQIVQRWDDLTPEQRSRAVTNYRRYKELSPEKREKLDRRYEKWRSLSPAEKDRMREKYQKYSADRGLRD